MKGKVFAEIAGELLDSTNSNFRGIVQIINDDGPVTAEKELKNSVASNVASTAGDKNRFRHKHTSEENEEEEESIEMAEEERFGNEEQIYTKLKLLT